MGEFEPFVIKSFKHDGHLHRMWLENWAFPRSLLHPYHTRESMTVTINSQTRIQESDGKEWTSRIPGISFFIPGQWYNIVALIEESGVRYYCNVASPPYVNNNVVTYIDYDLDVVVLPNGEVHVVDRDEYEQHKQEYHYSAVVQEKVEHGLNLLLRRIARREAPFQDDLIASYHAAWKAHFPEKG